MDAALGPMDVIPLKAGSRPVEVQPPGIRSRRNIGNCLAMRARDKEAPAMSADTRAPSTHRLPAGFRIVPIHRVAPGTPIHLGVVVRNTPDPVQDQFVILREHVDATVHLGAVVDAGGQVREWIELWVQNIDGLDRSLPAAREAFSNTALDDRWAEAAQALAAGDPAGALMTGFENHHPEPCHLDLSAGVAAFPEGWALCTDDAPLSAAGLPPFSRSLHRYLWKPGAEPKRFVPVTSDAPNNENTQAASEAIGVSAGHLAWNPGAGLLRAGRFAPLAFQEFSDLLGGKAWPGLAGGKVPIRLGPPYDGLDDWENLRQHGAHLFSGAKGRAGCFVESLQLKLLLLRDALHRVRTVVQHQQLPLLNLNADSFRVRLHDVGDGLPRFWTATVQLARTGDAFALPITTTEARYFVRCGANRSLSIYQPAEVGAGIQGTCTVRVRQNFKEPNGVVVEGTLVLSEPGGISPRDLFWIRLPLPTGRIDLYGHLYAADGRATGELRFRTLPLQLPAATQAALKSAEGIPLARTPFESVPLLSTACDLYSLGVLAIQTLLVNDTTSLAVALDEVLGLARRIPADTKDPRAVAQEIAQVLADDSHFREALGPHRLSHLGLPPAEAAALVPAELWSEVLALCIRFFPGAHASSYRRDLADAPSLALDTVFDAPLSDLDTLVRRSRSLMLIDWRSNREIAELLAAVSGGAPK